MWHEFNLTLELGTRREAFGPLFGAEETAVGHQWALPPLISYARHEETDWEQFDFLYPVFNYHRTGPEYRLQFLQLFSFAGGALTTTNDTRRFTVFPFYFQQRSTDRSRNYTALFPFYGHLQSRFNRDEVFSVGFPLYLQSRKRDVVTDNYLFPFFHLREGDHLRGWQLWPLGGYERKDFTTRTNMYGDIDYVPGHKKSFVLWPVFAFQKTGLGTDHAQTNRLFLPLAAFQRSPQRDQTSWLWPFFSFTDDREKHYREWSAPWPLVSIARGEGKTVNRFWPLFGHGRKPGLESSFYLWPIYKHTHIHSPPLDRDRTRILFFTFNDVTERNLETGEEKRRLDLWPLFVHRRGPDGNSRTQLLAPLEPILAYNRAIERNYSPLWSIWRREENAKTGAASVSLLWNLYRCDSGSDHRKCSLLFGLFQYQTGPEGADWRLFYLPGRKNRTRAYDSSPEK